MWIERVNFKDAFRILYLNINQNWIILTPEDLSNLFELSTILRICLSILISNKLCFHESCCASCTIDIVHKFLLDQKINKNLHCGKNKHKCQIDSNWSLKAISKVVGGMSNDVSKNGWHQGCQVEWNQITSVSF